MVFYRIESIRFEPFFAHHQIFTPWNQFKNRLKKFQINFNYDEASYHFGFRNDGLCGIDLYAVN